MDYNKLKKQVPESLKETVTFQTAGVKPLGKLAIGFGLAEKVGEEAEKFGQGKVLLVTDKTLVKLGVCQVISDSLEQTGFLVDIFDDVSPEPHIETAQQVQALVRNAKYSAVVGLGGGSPMDMAKVASMTATNPKDILDYLQGSAFEVEGLPCILLPTTSGTGSEVSPFIVTSTADKKMFIASPYLYATVALVDPLLTTSMPPGVTAATGLDALSHGVEGLIGKPTPVAEALTSKCVEYVFDHLESAYQDGGNLKARYYMSYASVLGMMSYTQGGGLYAHSCSYILTLDKGLPHGVGCGLALPYTLMFNFDYIKDILLRFADVIDSGLRSQEVAALKVVEHFYQILGKIGVANNLREIGVNEQQLSTYAQNLIEKYYRMRNPREMNIEQAQRFIELMWEGKLESI